MLVLLFFLPAILFAAGEAFSDDARGPPPASPAEPFVTSLVPFAMCSSLTCFFFVVYLFSCLVGSVDFVRKRDAHNIHIATRLRCIPSPWLRGCSLIIALRIENKMLRDLQFFIATC